MFLLFRASFWVALLGVKATTDVVEYIIYRYILKCNNKNLTMQSSAFFFKYFFLHYLLKDIQRVKDKKQ